MFSLLTPRKLYSTNEEQFHQTRVVNNKYEFCSVLESSIQVTDKSTENYLAKLFRHIQKTSRIYLTSILLCMVGIHKGENNWKFLLSMLLAFIGI